MIENIVNQIYYQKECLLSEKLCAIAEENSFIKNTNAPLRYKGVIVHTAFLPRAKVSTTLHPSLKPRMEEYLNEKREIDYEKTQFANYLAAGHRTGNIKENVCTGFRSWLQPYLEPHMKHVKYVYDTHASCELEELFSNVVQKVKERIVKNLLE